MADVRALLKAKRQESRISHPLASYTSSGQLRCSACGTAVKHASAWEGHIGSKAHRTNVARLREEERQQAEHARAEAQAHADAEAERQRASHVANGKRKAQDDEDDDMGNKNAMDTDTHDTDNGAKRRRVGPASGGFPADFFSDPSRAPIPITPDSDDEDATAEAPTTTGALPPVAAAPVTAIDLEYERFQREMLGDAATVPDTRETYERATVVAEPELAETEEIPSQFSTQDQQMDVDVEKEKQSEEELARRRREQEERELIMDRLLDEERAQEEADQRVAVMKARLEALRKKRWAKKSKASEPQ
ncbi:hypothetical protein DXG03_004145 [Asterophora parasitica]|uniref:Coiled-coil domain-containing protein 16 n=1 Tax=Asterophora parasitica TaxID=117018 RepID=A0A9P7G2N8_9AGAR|nr:hypothetical protein DXG03_004145 [Asterophora parasitica]